MPDLLTRSASLAPQTANTDARTIEVVWSTGAPVRRRDMSGEYFERLSLEPAAVDLSRLIGASVLDAHKQGAVRDVLGTVRSANVDGKDGKAIRIVEYDGKRVSYATDAEMATALADLERRITSTTTQRITQVRINSSKGV